MNTGHGYSFQPQIVVRFLRGAVVLIISSMNDRLSRETPCIRPSASCRPFLPGVAAVRQYLVPDCRWPVSERHSFFECLINLRLRRGLVGPERDFFPVTCRRSLLGSQSSSRASALCPVVG